MLALLLTAAVVTALLLLLCTIIFLVFHFFYKLPQSKDASFFSNIIVGHRGSKHPELDIPENSLQSMKFALDHKADGIEIDIMLSKDGIPMVFHDTNRVSRLCRLKKQQQQQQQQKTTYNTGSGEVVVVEDGSGSGGNSGNGSGDVKSESESDSEKLVFNTEMGIPFLTRQEIQSRFEYLRGHYEEHSGRERHELFPVETSPAIPKHLEHSIPTLDEFIDYMFARDPTKVLMIEIKEYERSREMAQYMIKTFKKYPHLYRQSVVASFNPIVLYMVRQMDPNIVTNLLFKEGFLADWMKYDPTVLKSKDYPVFLEQMHKSYFAGACSLVSQLLYACFMWSLPLCDWLLLQCMIYWLPSFIGAGVLGFENKMAYDLDFVRSLQKRGYRVNVWVVNTMHQKKQLLQVGNIAITTDYLFDYSQQVHSILPQSLKDELAK